MSKRLSEDVGDNSDEEEIPFKIRKNLFNTEFEKPAPDDHMQVYLRIRPFTVTEEDTENQARTLFMIKKKPNSLVNVINLWNIINEKCHASLKICTVQSFYR